MADSPLERGFLGSCVLDADGTDHRPCGDYPHCDCTCHQRERKVLVGRIYSTMSNTWNEQKDDTFDEVVERMSERRAEHAPKVSADEIIEVIVVRRARISSSVTVEEI